MPAKRPAIGDAVHIVFWDHAENSDNALRFEVFGRLVKTTKKAFIVKSWAYESDVDRASDANSDNETRFAIVKSAVDSIRVLK